MKRTFVYSMAILLVAASGSSAVQAQQANWQVRQPHERPGTSPVLDLRYSPDGSKVAVSYYRSPRNRPGTDWAVWSVIFDLETGKRTILPNTTGPFAFSRDGQWLALTHVNPGRHWNRDWQLALHRLEDEQSLVVLQSSPGDDPPIAVNFGTHHMDLMALHGSGQVRHWPLRLADLEGDSPQPQPIELARLGADLEVDLRVSQHSSMPLIGTLTRTQQGWTAFIPSAEWGALGHRRIVGPAAMTWRLTPRREIDRLTTFADLPEVANEHAFTMNWRELLPHIRTPITFAIPRHLAESDDGLQNRVMGGRPTVPVAYAPQNRLLAVSRAFGVELHSLEAVPPRRLPGSHYGTLAFSPDETQLAIADRRGIVRLWDLHEGRIVRSLRLDDEPTETFRVAAVQAVSAFGDPQTNRQMLTRDIRYAAQMGAWLVVLPEAAVPGYLSADLTQTWQANGRPTSPGLTGRDVSVVAETVPGPSTDYFAQVVRQHGVYLTVPLVEVDRRTGRYYNSVVLLGPDGQIILHYRKRDLWAWADQSWASPGDLGNPVVDTPLGRLGMLICFDIHKQAAIMSDRRIDLLLYSIAWVEEAESDWFEKRLPAIAAEQGYPIIAANWAIPPEADASAWHGHGQSRIIDRAGNILAKTESSLGHVIYADLPLPAVDARE